LSFLLVRNTDTLVPDTNSEFLFIGIVLGNYYDLSFVLTEFNCVQNKVEKYLLDPQFIKLKVLWHVIISLDLQSEALLLTLQLNYLAEVVNRITIVDFNLFLMEIVTLY
jgi:hypothetical protein